MRVLYIAVNYGTSAHARHFVECLRASPQDARLVLVDNTEPQRREPLAIDPALEGVVYYCPAPANLGYFGGARYGAASPMAGSFDADWIVVANVDLTFDPAQLRVALAHYDPAEVGIIAPAITSSDPLGNLNPLMESRPTRARMRAYKYIFHSYFGFASYSWLSGALRGRAWFGPRGDVQTADRADRVIYAPHGACIIFSREFFDRGGTLEHPPFLFGEEITVAEQARRLSLPIIYCPRISITHEQHASTSLLPSRLQHGFVSKAAAYVADAYFR